MEGTNFERLTSENFPIWKHRTEALLVTKGIGEAITNKDSQRSEQALALMCLCVSNEYVDLMANAESAQHAWSMLEEIHAGQTAARRLNLRKELTGLIKKPEESMMSFIMRAKQVCTSLRAIDGSVTDIHLIDAILSGLPQEYANKAESALSVREACTGQVAFATQNRRPKVSCTYCGRSGHTREKCWYLNGLPPHLQKQTRTNAENEEKVALASYALECGRAHILENLWIVDSGATTHICASREMFTFLIQNVPTQSIFVGNGEVVFAKESGNV
eukprot:scaffold408_cov347-Pavlova_lutheri.AAC.2